MSDVPTENEHTGPTDVPDEAQQGHSPENLNDGEHVNASDDSATAPTDTTDTTDDSDTATEHDLEIGKIVHEVDSGIVTASGYVRHGIIIGLQKVDDTLKAIVHWFGAGEEVVEAEILKLGGEVDDSKQ
jgi:hypothetical protein